MDVFGLSLPNNEGPHPGIVSASLDGPNSSFDTTFSTPQYAATSSIASTSVPSSLNDCGYEAMNAVEATNGTQIMCASCKKIDFDGAFGRSLDHVPRRGIPFSGCIKDFHPLCFLCNIVKAYMTRASQLSDGKGVQRGYHWRALDSTWIFRYRYSKRVSQKKSIVVLPLPGRPIKNLRPSRISQATTVGFYTPYRSQSSLGEALEEFQIVAKQISARCNEDTFAPWRRALARKRDTDQAHPRVFTRVVDCQTHKIVPLEQDMTYLTLSYVWGPSTSHGTTELQTKELPDNAPQTVRDAVVVTLQLHQRYLWIDRYCIWHGDNKLEQIASMDQIYAGSYCTIIALEGSDADCGLSGISKPRKSSAMVEAQNLTFVEHPPHLSWYLQQSPWSTRAWCYQEAVLSSACLFFTPDLTYLSIGWSVRSEALCQTEFDLPSMGTRPACMLPFDRWYENSKEVNAPNETAAHVMRYSSRVLSYDDDALNAFVGIISAHRIPTFWGVPVLCLASYNYELLESNKHGIDTRMTRYQFAHALCWSRSAKAGYGLPARRGQFPTWSWLNLRSSVDMKLNSDLTVSTFVNRIIERDCAEFYALSASEQLLSMHQLFLENGTIKNYVIAEPSQTLIVHTWSVYVDLVEDDGPRLMKAICMTLSGVRLDGNAIIDEQVDAGRYLALFIVEDQGWVANSTKWMLCQKLADGCRRIGTMTLSGTEDKGPRGTEVRAVPWWQRIAQREYFHIR